MANGKLLDVIGKIYEASYDPSVWSEVLADITKLTASKSSALLYIDHMRPEANCHFSHAVPMRALQAYADYYHKLDPFFELSAQAVPMGKACADHQLVPDRRELERLCGAFFTGYMKPHDHWHIAGAMIFRDEHRQAAITLQRRRSQGPWSEEELRQLDLLAPHFQRSFRIHGEFTRLRIQEAAAYAAMDRMIVGVVLIDLQQYAVYRNPMARSILSNHPAIEERNGKICATLRQEAGRFSEALWRATVADPHELRSITTAMGLHHPNSEWPLPVLITPIQQGKVWGPHYVNQRGAAIFLSDTECSHPIAADALQAAYSLTAREAEIAVAISNGYTIDELASAQKVSYHTVRVQLKSVFKKLRVSRQADLVRILLTGPYGTFNQGNSGQ